MTPERWRRIAEIYEGALERPAAERASFIGNETDGDRSLRREVEDLLAHDRAPFLLDRPVLAVAGDVLDAEAPLNEKSIEVVNITTGARKVVIQGGSYARYLPSGHLVFLRSGTLMAAPFDTTRLELTGPPTPVIEGVHESLQGAGAFSCSRSGTCAYVAGGMAAAQREIVLTDRNGAEQVLPLPPRRYAYPRFSPKGDALSVQIAQVNCEVMVYDLARGTFTRVSVDGDNHRPVWTPDGTRITYMSKKAASNDYELMWKPPDASRSEERVFRVAQHLPALTGFVWSPDTRTLAYIQNGDIWLASRSGDSRPAAFLQTRYVETMPAFSPDGRWLAYVSDESGRSEIYVQAINEPRQRYAIGADGGTEPVWGPDSRELFFRSGDAMMVARVTTAPGFKAERARRLFSAPFLRSEDRTTYDISPDGQKFVFTRDKAQAAFPGQIDIILDWFDELKARGGSTLENSQR
jgi:serine/threonine-protein kinase